MSTYKYNSNNNNNQHICNSNDTKMQTQEQIRLGKLR